MSVLTGAAVIGLFVVSFAPGIAGAIISRRTWKRHGWPEMKLAFRAFMAGLLIFVVSVFAFPLVGWLITGNSYDTFGIFRVISAVIAIANGIATIAIAIALYRLASRSDSCSQSWLPPSSHSP